MEELYNALFSSGDYTKSFEEFKEQFNSEESVKALYSSMNENKDYTKSFEEFKTQFQFEIPQTAKTTPQEAGAPVEEVAAPETPDTESPSEDTLSVSQETSKQIPEIAIEDSYELTNKDGSKSVLNRQELEEYAKTYNLTAQQVVDRFNQPGYGVKIIPASVGIDLDEVVLTGKAPEIGDMKDDVKRVKQELYKDIDPKIMALNSRLDKTETDTERREIEKELSELRERRDTTIEVAMRDYSEPEREVFSNLLQEPKGSEEELESIVSGLETIQRTIKSEIDSKKGGLQLYGSLVNEINSDYAKIESEKDPVKRNKLIDAYSKKLKENKPTLEYWDTFFNNIKILEDELKKGVDKANKMGLNVEASEAIERAENLVYDKSAMINQDINRFITDVASPFIGLVDKEGLIYERERLEKQAEKIAKPLSLDTAKKEGKYLDFVLETLSSNAASTVGSIGMYALPGGQVVAPVVFGMSAAGGRYGDLMLQNKRIDDRISNLQSLLEASDDPLQASTIESEIKKMEDLKVSDGEIAASTLFSGVIEGGITRLSGALGAGQIRPIKYLLPTTSLAKVLYDNTRKAFVKKAASITGAEVVEEGLIAGLDAGIVDNLILGNDVSLSDIYTWDFLADVLVNSVAVGGASNAVPGAVRLADSARRKSTRNSVLNELASINKEIKATIDLQVEDPSSDYQEYISSLKQKGASLARQIDLDSQNAVANLGNLTDEDFKKLYDLRTKQANVRRRASEVNAKRDAMEDKLRDKTFDSVIKELQKEYDGLEAEASKLLGEDQLEGLSPKEQVLMDTFVTAKGLAKSKGDYVELDSSFSNLYVKYIDNKLEEKDVDTFKNLLKNNYFFNKISKTKSDKFLSKIKTTNDLKEILRSNASFDSGINLVNSVAVEQRIKDKSGISDLGKRVAAISPKHEVLHGYTLETDVLDNLDEKLLEQAEQELEARIEKNITNKKDLKDAKKRIALYKNKDNVSIKTRYEELINLYNDLNTVGYINDSDIDSSFRLKDLVRGVKKSVFGKVSEASDAQNQTEAVIEHLRSFEKFYASKKKLKDGGLSRGTGRLLSRSEELESLTEQLNSGEIDEFTYYERMDALEAEKPKYKGTRDFKKVLDDIGKNPEGYDFFDENLEPTIRQMVAAKSRRFRTQSGDVVNLENLPGFNMEDFTSEVYFNLLTGKKLKEGGYGPGYIQVFDPNVNDSLYGYINAQLGNRMRSVLAEGEMTTEQFTVQAEEQVGLSQEMDYFDEFDNKEYTEEQISRGLINPITLVDVSLQEELVDEIRSKMAGIDLENLIFKKTPNLAVSTFAKHFNVRESVIAKASQNLNTTELESTAPLLYDIADLVIKILPKGAIVGGRGQLAVSEKLIGTGTGLPRKILDAFYEKKKRLLSAQEGVGRKGAGLEPFSLKENITKQDFLEALGINPDGTHNPNIKPKSPQSQTRRAMLDLLGKLASNTGLRQEMDNLGISPIAVNNLREGSSERMLSDAVNDPELSPEDKKRIQRRFRIDDPVIDITAYFSDIEDIFGPDFSRLGSYAGQNKTIVAALQHMTVDIIEQGEVSERIKIYLQQNPLVKKAFEDAEVTEDMLKDFFEEVVEMRKQEDNGESNPKVQKHARYLIKTAAEDLKIFDEERGNNTLIRNIYGLTSNSENVEVSTVKVKRQRGQDRFLNRTKEEKSKVGKIKKGLFYTNQLSTTINKHFKDTLDSGLSNQERLDEAQRLTEESKKYNRLKREIAKEVVSSTSIYMLEAKGQEFLDRALYTIYAFTNTNYGLKNLAEISKNTNIFGEETLKRGDAANREAIKQGKRKPAYVRVEHIVPTSFQDFIFLNAAFTGKMPLINHPYKAGITDNTYSEEMDKRFIKLYKEDGTYSFIGYKMGALSPRHKYFLKRAEEENSRVFSLGEDIEVSEDLRKQAESQQKADYLEYAMGNILKKATGIPVNEQMSQATARINADNRKKKFTMMVPSAEDFNGLLYSFVSKGKEGDAQMAFFKKFLTDPLNRAYVAMTHVRQKISRDFKDLNKEYEVVKKSLNKETGYKNYTNDQAIRVYLYKKAGVSNSTLLINETDEKALLNIVNSNPEMAQYAEYLMEITGTKDKWVEPKSSWTFGSVFDDVERIVDNVKRAEFIAEWKENADAIFTPNNLNKIQSYYGDDFRRALEDKLYAIEKGKVIPEKSSKEMAGFQKWLTGSVAVTMFLNRRSMVLQLLSFANYINWSDNNPIKAAAAFANIPQYASDLVKIFNSDYLKERRGGLKTEVEAAVLANELRKGGAEGFRGVVNKILQYGFTLTQIGDSLAISIGGATFYRNRKNSYLDQGLTEKEAHDQAWLDFIEISEESQQSARPDKLSMQQTNSVGRVFLAFQNTPMQYYRLITKSVKDLVNGRGDIKTNISKIAYYGFVQSLIFNGLQQALFAYLGDAPEDDDEKFQEEKDKRLLRTVNNTLDGILRGSGLHGAYVATAKNVLLQFNAQEKKGFKADHVYTVIELLNLSAPVGIKLRTLYQGGYQNYAYNKEIIDDLGFDIDNPAYDIIASLLSFGVNIPADKVINMVRGLSEAADQENDAWQRIALLLGWSTWNLGMPNEKIEEAKKKNTARKRREADLDRKIKRERKKSNIKRGLPARSGAPSRRLPPKR